MNKLIITIGIPGAGKTTFIKTHFSNLPIISLDDIRKELYGNPAILGNSSLVTRIARDRIRHYLSDSSVVYDATNLYCKNRTSFINKFSDIISRQDVIAIYFDVSLENALKNNENRIRHVPKKVIENMFYSMDIPYEEEFGILIRIEDQKAIEFEEETSEEIEEILELFKEGENDND